MPEINRYGLSAGGTLQTAAGYFPEGQAPSTLNDAARTVMADIRREYQCRSGELTATYSAGTYSVTFEREITSGELGGIFACIADSTNSGSAKININALGAKDLKTPYGHLQQSDIPAQSVMVFNYNKTGDFFSLLSRTSRDSRPDTCRIKTGTYTGTGIGTQAITGIGFQPKYVRIWRRRTADGSTMNIYESSDVIVDDGGVGGGAIELAVSPPEFATNAIMSLDADGFTVNEPSSFTDTVNGSGTVYNYLCLG